MMLTYKELLAQSQELARQAEEARKRELGEVIAKIKSLMAEYEIHVEDLTARTSSPKKKSVEPRDKVAPKYKNEAGQTWTGRGKPPKWVTDHIEAGGTREDLLIKQDASPTA